MNRLWVRFALVITLILLAVSLLPLVFGPALMPGLLSFSPDPRFEALQEALPPELQAESPASYSGSGHLPRHARPVCRGPGRRAGWGDPQPDVAIAAARPD